MDTHGVTGQGWVGFDLDGTLAKYDKWQGIDHIGEPIAPMVRLRKRYHERGMKVKILTARVAPRMIGDTHATGCKCGHCESDAGKGAYMQEQYLSILEGDISRKKTASDYITEWCEKNLGFVPEITHQKDHLMTELYDDRAKQVIANDGRLVEDIALEAQKAAMLMDHELTTKKFRFQFGLMIGAIVTLLIFITTDIIFECFKNRTPYEQKVQRLHDAAHDLLAH